MQIGFTPDDLLSVKLDLIDGHLPEDQRITWKVLAMSRRDMQVLRTRAIEAHNIEDDDKKNDALDSVILSYVKGWDRAEPLNPTTLNDLLSPADKLGLIAELPQRVEEVAWETKKALRLQRRSAQNASAQTVKKNA